MAIIGIDLGTTNSLVSYWKDGKIQLLRGNDGSNMFASAAHFMKDGIMVGNEYMQMSYLGPDLKIPLIIALRLRTMKLLIH